MSKYFGTDGIRGIANKELTCDIAFKLGQYLGYIYKDKKILIGSDTRLSKDMLESSLCAGITSTGAHAYCLKVVSTPCVSYLVANNDFVAGIMISASHNPFYDNGLKVFNDEGEKISAELESDIEKYLDNEIDIELAMSNELGKVVDYTSEIDSYIEFLSTTVNSDLSNLRILVDCANGSAYDLSKKLFNKLNIKADYINDNPNGININLDCGSTHLDSLKEKIVKDKYDISIAFDGDADRMLALTNNGKVIDGDLIIYLCAKNLIAKNKLKNNTVVTTIMSNIGLYKALDKMNVKYDKTNVGDKYVYESMKANDYVLGGEQSGHIIFKEYAKTGDGLLSAIQLLEAIKLQNKSVNELVDELVIYPQVLKNIKVKDKDFVLNNLKLKEAILKVENDLKNEGRVLLRASGTEPLIRVMVEAKSDDLCHKYVDYLIDIIKDMEV